MKIIFLDVDGVLNCMETEVVCKTPPNYSFVEDVFVGRLKKIVERTGAQIVLSSDWRFGWVDAPTAIKEEFTHLYEIGMFSELKAKLMEYGIELMDRTPCLYGGAYRGREIKRWLDNHNDIEKFVILDDRGDMFPVYDRLIQTDWFDGLTEELMWKAIEALGGDTNGRELD